MINKDKEVGGTHYADMKVEPIEVIEALNMNFIQGCILKYISRYRHKGGIEDLKKALHYAKIGAGKDKESILFVEIHSEKRKLIVKMFCVINGLDETDQLAIEYASCEKYDRCAETIERIISNMEDEE